MYFYPGKTRTYRRVFLRVQRQKLLDDFLARQYNLFQFAHFEQSAVSRSLIKRGVLP